MRGALPPCFHVTDADALPSIARHGLLSAEALCTLFDMADAGTLSSRNRDRYVPLTHPVHGTAALRRQKLHDRALGPHLADGVTAEAWRRFINAHVFFWVSAGMAETLRRAEPGRRQVVLALRSAALLGSGLPLLAAPVNGGAVPRAAPRDGRLRGLGLYRPVHALPACATVKEVAVPARIPPEVLHTARHG